MIPSITFRLIEAATERGFVTSNDYGFAGQWIGSGFPDGASVSAQISASLGLADLGIGLGSEANPTPYARPNTEFEVTDAKGIIYLLRFNEFNSIIEVTDPIGRKIVLNRNVAGSRKVNPAERFSGSRDDLSASWRGRFARVVGRIGAGSGNKTDPKDGKI